MTIERAYYLACELSPTLPDHRLLRLLPGKYVELITSAVTNGISSGLANYDQLAKVYEQGARYGIEPTEQEFRSLMTEMIREALEGKSLTVHERLKLMGRLVRYYEQGHSLVPPTEHCFGDKAPEAAQLTSGFLPLDTVLGGSFTSSVGTIISPPGTGKSYVSLAIANAWLGPVLFYDPENSKAMALKRSERSGVVDKDKKIILGDYDVEDILERIKDEPQSNLLVILDSLSVVCGDGRSLDSAQKYVRAYTYANAMLQYCSNVLITTHIRRGIDGDSIEAAAASSKIERSSGYQIHLSKDGTLDDGCQLYRFYCSKNRDGVTGLECKFAFDYASATCRRIIETPIPTAYKPQDIDEMEYYDG